MIFAPKPECALCCRPVERIEVARNPAQMSTEVAVWCHGQIEVLKIADHLLESVDGAIPYRAFEGTSENLPEDGG